MRYLLRYRNEGHQQTLAEYDPESKRFTSSGNIGGFSISHTSDFTVDRNGASLLSVRADGTVSALSLANGPCTAPERLEFTLYEGVFAVTCAALSSSGTLHASSFSTSSVTESPSFLFGSVAQFAPEGVFATSFTNTP